ncbi:MAG: RDD family protein [Candidatus Izemoplasmatales bacterium]|jgi:uncharacterized RDD family membrane protein YckC
MEIDDKTYKEYDTIYRYQKSILLDQFFGFIPLAIIVFVGGPIIARGNEIVKYVCIFLSLGVFALLFLSDKIFKGASLGKRIFKIKLVNIPRDISTPIQNIVYRRLLEIYIHPMLSKMNFLEKTKYIEHATKTKIISFINENEND